MSKKNSQGLLARLRQLSFRVKVIIAAVIAVILALIVLAIVIALVTKPAAGPQFSKETQDRQQIATAQVAYENTINDDAKTAYQQGGAAKVDEVYKKAIDAETDKHKKIKLIINESQLLYAYDKTSQAIAVAKTADAASDDKFLMSDWLAKLYEDQKQYSQAAQYYTLAGTWVASPDNIGKQLKGYYDQQATRVAALVGAK
jgi:uncharacterized protein YxeA